MPAASPSPASAVTASAQNSRPTTDAAPIVRRSGRLRRSRRAASSAWIVGGTLTSAPSPDSRRNAIICWRKSGLPSARAASCVADRVQAPPLPAAGRGSARACPCRRSGPSSSSEESSLSRPQSGRCSISSSRAMQTSISGASAVCSSRCSTRSRRAGSAQCRSSSTSTTGRSRASVPTKSRTAIVRSSRAVVASSRPAACSTRSASSSARASAANRRSRAARGSALPRHLSHDLRERPVRDALAIGQAAPDEHRGALRQRLAHLAREP